MDYASVVTSTSNVKVLETFEVLQNNALRVIFKKTLIDKVSIDSLLERANLDLIKLRHDELINNYYNKALITNNTLLIKVYESYKSFKRRKMISEGLALGPDGVVDLERLDLIRQTNHGSLINELHPTLLCKSRWVMREFLLDCYGYGPVGTGIR